MTMVLVVPVVASVVALVPLLRLLMVGMVLGEAPEPRQRRGLPDPRPSRGSQKSACSNKQTGFVRRTMSIGPIATLGVAPSRDSSCRRSYVVVHVATWVRVQYLEYVAYLESPSTYVYNVTV